jgi:hypothetical protein
LKDLNKVIVDMRGTVLNGLFIIKTENKRKAHCHRKNKITKHRSKKTGITRSKRVKSVIVDMSNLVHRRF